MKKLFCILALAIVFVFTSAPVIAADELNVNGDNVTLEEFKKMLDERKNNYKFNPKGMTDPFMPPQHLFPGGKDTRVVEAQLSQFSLRAIITNSENENNAWALFEDSAGKGFIVTTGDVVGNGTIKKINTDTVDVLVTEEDFRGEPVEKTVRVELHIGG